MSHDSDGDRTTADIIHDLNNLLASIIGYADFLQEDLSPGTPQHQFAESIYRGGVEAQALIGRMVYNGDRAFVQRIKHDAALNQHILIVEDQDDIREMMEIMIERLGGTSESCGDAYQAVDLLRENIGQFHLVMVDHGLPGMTGAELAKIIAMDFPALPVILMSGEGPAQLASLHKAYPSLRAVLQKPIDFSELAEIIHAL